MEILYPDCSLYQGYWTQMSHNTGTSETSGSLAMLTLSKLSLYDTASV